MQPAAKSPRFYGTIPFGILATVILLAAIWAVSSAMPNLEGRPTAGIQQFGVVLLAAYWLFIFPRGRKSHVAKKPEGDSKPPAAL